MAMTTQRKGPLSAAEAHAYVDGLYERVHARWERRVNQSEFMTLLNRGELPLDVVRIFYRNFGSFAIEINTVVGASYGRHLPFLRSHPHLMAPLGEKIAEEYLDPRPPGHVLVMLETAAALGIPEQAVYEEPYLPSFRGMIDFSRTLLYEGTIAEWYAGLATEELIGHWSKAWRRALVERYALPPEALIYFQTHIEADLEEHEGQMGHGTFNRRILECLLAEGLVEERTGYGIEYCAMTAVDLHGQMLRAALDAYREGGEQ